MNNLSSPRIQSIDLLKGLVMVIMALDHVRDYFHYPSYFFDPNNPELTSVAIFSTRFITNFCAPAFSFLAGVSAFMVGRRKNLQELSVFLLKRGAWLIFVELVIMDFGWMFDINLTSIVFQVIWSLGISMIILAAVIHLRREYILVLSCLVIFGHNLLDGIHFEGNMFWAFFHERVQYQMSSGHIIRVGYPLIPWFAVMSLGYYFGGFYDTSFDPIKRKKVFNVIGVSTLVLLILLRWTNAYGNPLPWKEYGALSKNIFSFFGLTKYPPSLLFLLLTLGGCFLFLANTETLTTSSLGLKGRAVKFFCVFGRVPFLYYITHIYFIHFLALIVASFTAFGWQAMILHELPFRVKELQGFGYNLITVYLIWIGVVLLLYPICKAFDSYKQNHKEKWWLSYL